MSKINNGGPAFPTVPISGNAEKYCGMTLRDWFAGQALQSLIDQDPKTTNALDAPNGRTWDAWIAMNAYGIADAMLGAREVKPS